MATVGLDPAERRPVYIGVSAASLETIGSELSPVFTGDSSASVPDKLVHGSGRTAGPIGILDYRGCCQLLDRRWRCHFSER